MSSRNDHVYPSFLQLLTDDDPKVRSEASVPGTRVEDLEKAILSSISNILNTRWRLMHLNEEELTHTENDETAHASLYIYGIPDFVATENNFILEPQLLLNQIKHAVERFEPRLNNVRIEEHRLPNGNRRNIHFRVFATLSVSPYTPVTFSSQMDLSTGRFEVTELRTS
ncbi:MAG: type VI secretion system baseplate subunit TssE [Planctomycetaceae bacterium]